MVHHSLARTLSSGRLCPTCGETSDARYCPNDHSPTFYFADHLAHQGPVALGEHVGGYIVGAPIGRGGHATVYRADRVAGLGQVALKVLHVDRADPHCVSRFYREALIGAQLSHPNTVRVLDVGQADAGAIYLAMELLQGQTWEARLQQVEARGGTMQPHEAIAIAAEVLRGLAEAHDQSVVHRDLKPSNVMLAEAGGEPFVKIMDFGIAHVLLSGLTEDGRSVGTPAYMSPEQCNGGKLDGRSDLYAVGVALYRSVTGRLPFAETSALGLMFAHTSLPPLDVAVAAPQPLPTGLATVVMRALAKHPDERYSDARAMRQALEAVLSGRAVDAPRPVVRAVPMAAIVTDGTPPTSAQALRLPDPQPPAATTARRDRFVASLVAVGMVASALLAFSAPQRSAPTAVKAETPPAATPSQPPTARTEPPLVGAPLSVLAETASARLESAQAAGAPGHPSETPPRATPKPQHRVHRSHARLTPVLPP